MKNDRFKIPKSRYASVSSYLSSDNVPFNDIELVVAPEHEQMLLDNGMDPILARHFAHLWVSVQSVWGHEYALKFLTDLSALNKLWNQ